MSDGAVPKSHKKPGTAPIAIALAHTKLTWKVDQANTSYCLFYYLIISWCLSMYYFIISSITFSATSVNLT